MISARISAPPLSLSAHRARACVTRAERLGRAGRSPRRAQAGRVPVGQRWMPHLARLARCGIRWLCGVCYGVTKLTDVPQFAKPFLVPPQVPMVRVNCGGAQFGDWMYSLAK